MKNKNKKDIAKLRKKIIMKIVKEGNYISSDEFTKLKKKAGY